MFLLFSVLTVCVILDCIFFLLWLFYGILLFLFFCCAEFLLVSVFVFCAGPPVLAMGGFQRTYYWGVGGFMGGPPGSSHFDSFGTVFE